MCYTVYAFISYVYICTVIVTVLSVAFEQFIFVGQFKPVQYFASFLIINFCSVSTINCIWAKPSSRWLLVVGDCKCFCKYIQYLYINFMYIVHAYYIMCTFIFYKALWQHAVYVECTVSCILYFVQVISKPILKGH